MDQQDKIKQTKLQNGVFIALIVLLGLTLLVTFIIS